MKKRIAMLVIAVLVTALISPVSGGDMPDLVIIDKHETWTDNTFTVSYKVNNQGYASAGESKATLYVDGIEEHQYTPPLGSGESTGELTFTTVVDCPCGDTIHIKVCADNGEVVGESNEDNNCVEQDVPCPGKPDLVIIDKRETWTDSTFTVSYKVNNQGCASAGESEATLYVDGIEEHQYTPALDSGESTGELTFTTVVNCPCGDTIHIKVCADNGGVVGESNEDNNCVEQDVECPAVGKCKGLTPGYWKNWRNHYTEDQFAQLLAGTIADVGDMDANIAAADDIFSHWSAKPGKELTILKAHLLATQLTLSLTGSDLPNPDDAYLTLVCTIEWEGDEITVEEVVDAALDIIDDPDSYDRKEVLKVKDQLDIINNLAS